ncbi:MAG: polyprenyl synthetase family protein [Candidatus Gracilibacteria bacterium]
MLPEWYSIYKELIEKSINNYLIECFNHEKNKGLETIKQATFYAVKGGKRIRPILALEFYLIFSGKDISDIIENDSILKLCIALELLHGYSLVHDDLPAMDNDDYRRGQLTTWKKYGEANGILVGDLLNSLAFEILAEINNSEIIKLFGKSVGIKGMLGGQVLDLYYENNPDKLNLENLIEVHNKKTGALIEISIIGGILLSNSNLTNEKQILTKYSLFGKKIGLAFQVKDDLLDVEGSFEETGKSVGGEEKGFVFFIGLKKTKAYLNDLINECFELIKEIDSKKINFLVEYIGKRNK